MTSTTLSPALSAPPARRSPSTAHGRRTSAYQETYIDFLGTKAGIRLNYGGNFTVYGTKDGKLDSYQPEYDSKPMFEEEIAAFLRSGTAG